MNVMFDRGKLNIKALKKPIEKELKIFEASFKKSLSSSVSYLDRITYYIYKRKGKQMRPMFVLYAAKACGTIGEDTYLAASMVELLHTATLVHDDVVDDASTRRGFFSINALWKNKAAVLVGDFMLAKGLLLATENRNIALLDVLSKAVREMSEGELLQMEKSQSLNVDEATYFQIIRKKTASLIAASCEAGAISTTQNSTDIEALHRFGLDVGMAFQIKDDLLDYGTNSIGKPKGNDLKEKKVTLPLIYYMDGLSSSEQKKLKRTIKKYSKDSQKMDAIVKLVRASDAIQRTEQKMLEYRQLALNHLECLPDSEAKENLEALMDYTINRTK